MSAIAKARGIYRLDYCRPEHQIGHFRLEVVLAPVLNAIQHLNGSHVQAKKSSDLTPVNARKDLEICLVL
jgi:hypothetical protein